MSGKNGGLHYNYATSKLFFWVPIIRRVSNSSSGRGGWTGYGRTGNIIVFWSLVLGLLFLVMIPFGGYSFITRYISSGFGAPVYAPAGALAYCSVTGTSVSVTAPPPGCASQLTTVTVTVSDFYAGKSLSGWSCTYFSPTGQFYESMTNTGANGNCVGTRQYQTGSPVIVQVCHSTTACGSGSYAQQITTFFSPLPCAGGAGAPLGGLQCPGGSAGNVPFTPPTTSPPYALAVALPVVLLQGDAYVANTPNKITISWPNGTTFAASNTGFCNSGTASLGAKWNLGFLLQVGTSGTVPANPFGAGYNPFTPVNLQSGPSARGSLQDVLQAEIKETSTTGTTLTPIGGPFVKTAQKPASTSDVVYTVPLNGLTLAQDPSGAPGYLATTPGGNQGFLSFSQGFDCTAIKNGSAVTVTITCDWYNYYSQTYVGSATSGSGGSVNSEAVKTAATNTVTIKT